MIEEGTADLRHGMITFLKISKGYGYIKDDNGETIYFHITGLLSPEFSELREGYRVVYYVVNQNHPKGPKAIGVKVRKYKYQRKGVKSYVESR